MNKLRILFGGLAAGACLMIGTAAAFAQNARTLEVLQTNSDIRTNALGDVLGARQDRMSLFVSPLAMMGREGVVGAELTTQIYPAIDGVDGRPMQYNAAVGYKFLDRHAISVDFRYQNGPVSKNFDVTKGIIGADITPFDWAAGLSYGFQFTPDFSASLTGNLIASYVGGSFGNYTGAVSLGAFYNHAYTWSEDYITKLGVALRVNDIGAPISYGAGMAYALPTNVQLSAEYGGLRLAPKHYVNLLLGTRYFFLPSTAQLFQFGGGIEYDYNNFVFARLGYQYATREASKLTAGVGLKFMNRYSIDAAYSHGMNVDYGVDIWSVGLSARF